MSDKFKDINLKFTRHPVTGDVAMLSNEKCVAQAMREIVYTTAGDWKYGDVRRMGVGVESQLGENNNPLTMIGIRDRIQENIEEFEPRAELTSVSVTQGEDDPHALLCSITYYVKNEPDEKTVRIPLVRLR